MKTSAWNKKRNVIWFLLCFIFLLHYSPLTSHACSCVEPDNPKEELARSSAVFSGKVIEIVDKNKSNPIQSSADPIAVKFEVGKTWKGINETEVIVYTVRDSASCGYEFDLNQEYIVYAREVDGQLEVTLCSRTNLLALAQQDLDELGEGKKPTEQVAVDIDEKNAFSQLAIVLIITGLGIVMILVLRKRRKKE